MIRGGLLTVTSPGKLAPLLQTNGFPLLPLTTPLKLFPAGQGCVGVLGGTGLGSGCVVPLMWPSGGLGHGPLPGWKQSSITPQVPPGPVRLIDPDEPIGSVMLPVQLPLMLIELTVKRP